VNPFVKKSNFDGDSNTRSATIREMPTIASGARIAHYAVLSITVSLLSATQAIAGLTSCNVPTPTTYNLGTSTNGLISPGTADLGCEQVNEQFSGFAYTQNSLPPSPTGPNVNANFGGTTETGGVTATFSSAGWSDPTAGTLCCAGSSVNFDTAVDTSFGDYAVTALTLTVGSPSLGGGIANGSQLNVYLEFCVGATTFNCNITSPNFGEIRYALIANGTTTHVSNFICYNNGATSNDPCLGTLTSIGSSTTISINLASYFTTTHGTQTIALDNSVSYDTETSNTVSVASVEDTLTEANEAPEPSTFLLLGAALAGLAVWGGAMRSHRVS
jgi:PEP-CTERM motif